MIIAVDFDGTIHDGRFPCIGGVKCGADKYLRKLKEDGHYIILYTCRNGEDLLKAVNWMLENNIPFDRVNDNSPSNLIEFNSTNTRKIYADVYVDDKQIGGLPIWSEIYKWISEKK